MSGYFKRHLHDYWSEAAGLAFFFTWVFCTLFGCGLVTTPFIHWGLEYIWEIAGLAEAVVALIGLGIIHRVKEHLRSLGTAAMLFAVAGNLAIWFGYFDHAYFWAMRAIGGTCCGIAFVCFAVIWGSRLCSYDEATIEFIVPFSFALAFAFYCILLLTKVSSIPVLVMDCAFPVLSFYFMRRLGKPDLDEEPMASRKRERAELKDYLSLLVLVGFLWFQIAYFRVISTPDELGNRYWHFLVPFFCSCVIATLLFVFCIKVSRYLNFTLMFRWSLPLSLLSYAILFIGYQNPVIRTLAYTVNFIGMFGVQFGCWMAAPKYLRRTKESSPVFFLGLAVAQGIGIYAGCKISMFLQQNMSIVTFMTVSLFMMAVIVLVAMLVGFNPRWLFNRDPGLRAETKLRPVHAADVADAYKTSSPAASDAGDNLEELFEEQALDLKEAFGLTERETEVATLLLAGRSRPYIRDELIVSLNTVHAHARSILAKCNVHSQQELMDLARSRAKSR